MSEYDDMAAFAEERLGEDEGKAENLATATCLAGARPDFCGAGGPAADDYWRHFTPARMTAGVEAKRAVLNEWAAFSGILEGQAMRGEPVDKVMAFQVRVLEGVIRKLVAEWTGHPGYKESWKP